MPDSFDALIPVKALALAKTRLGGALTSPERAALVSAMLARVLIAARQACLVRAAYVVSSDSEPLEQAKRFGAQALPDPGHGLNHALSAAVTQRIAAGANAIAIVQGDLPWLDASALDAFLAAVPEAGAAIAPDQHGAGTSALAWRGAPGLRSFAFGADSFARHAALAREGGLALRRLGPSAAFRDVDDEADLAAYRRDFAPMFEASP